MTKIIPSVVLIAVALVCMVDCRTCKNVGEKCKSDEDCTSGNCQRRRCEERTESRKNILRAPNHPRTSRQLRLGELKPKRGVNQRSGTSPKSYRWPNGTMPYELDPAFTSSEREMILKSFKAIERNTCVDFVKRKKEKDWVYFERGLDSACASDIGKQGGKQILDLSVTKTKGASHCFHPEIIIHEILHALGFHHEQNRHDRDDYITINWDNIACGFRWNFDKDMSSSETTFGLPYDYTSIMHYERSEGGVHPNVPVLIPKPNYGFKIGSNKLSELDILRINRMYNCVAPT